MFVLLVNHGDPCGSREMMGFSTARQQYCDYETTARDLVVEN
jgi:hypothetical protein